MWQLHWTIIRSVITIFQKEKPWQFEVLSSIQFLHLYPLNWTFNLQWRLAEVALDKRSGQQPRTNLWPHLWLFAYSAGRDLRKRRERNSEQRAHYGFCWECVRPCQNCQPGKFLSVVNPPTASERLSWSILDWSGLLNNSLHVYPRAHKHAFQCICVATHFFYNCMSQWGTDKPSGARQQTLKDVCSDNKGWL